MVEIRHNNIIKVEQVRSNAKITRGVPKGSVLGPIVFILFTNDFASYIQEYSNCFLQMTQCYCLVDQPLNNYK